MANEDLCDSCETLINGPLAFLTPVVNIVMMMALCFFVIGTVGKVKKNWKSVEIISRIIGISVPLYATLCI